MKRLLSSQDWEPETNNLMGNLYLLLGPQCLGLSIGLQFGVFLADYQLAYTRASRGGEGTVVGSRKQWVVKTGR